LLRERSFALVYAYRQTYEKILTGDAVWGWKSPRETISQSVTQRGEGLLAVKTGYLRFIPDGFEILAGGKASGRKGFTIGES